MAGKMLTGLSEAGVAAYAAELDKRIEVAHAAWARHAERVGPAQATAFERTAIFDAVLSGLNFVIEQVHISDSEHRAVARAEAKAPGPSKAKEEPAPPGPTPPELQPVLVEMGFRQRNREKPGLWSKVGKDGEMFWDYRRTERGEFYASVDGAIVRDDRMKIAPEYQRIRALQDGQQQARLEPAPAQAPAAAALPAAQPAAPAPAQPAPVADPAVRRSVVLPKGPPRMGLVRVQLHMDEPPRRFGAALKQWGAEHGGEGYWWLDLPEEAAARRIEWADLNKVPWYISETRKNIPSGTPPPPRLD